MKFSIISLLLLLLLLEVIFRVLFFFEYKGYHTSVYVQGNTLQMSDSQLVFRNRPLYVDHHRRFQFNEEGIKARPGDVRMPAKQPGDFWVFLFGGSAMEGSGSNKDGEWLDITGVTDYNYEETIAACLEKYLQQRMPSRRVRVFNAANTGFSVWQSRMQYERLSAKYAMDYVVSLDGENELPSLAPGTGVAQRIRQRWQESPLFDFPLNVIIPVTSHSAFVNKIKQGLFHAKLSARLARNKEQNFPARSRWLSDARPLKFAQPDTGTGYAVQAFYAQLHGFDSLLSAKQQRHLLYLQPHLILRDTTKMTAAERALLHYYAASYNDPVNNTFKKRLHDSFNERATSPHLRTLAFINTWQEEAFVDYCHFTRRANEMIATVIGAEILKDSTVKN